MSRLSAKTSLDSGWSIDSVEYLYLEGVSWELYEHLLKVAENRRLRITYDKGELEIMSPLPEHENAARVIGRLIEEMTMQSDVPAIGLKATTFRRRLKSKGLEPDECYYIKSQPRLIGKKRISLPKDPPPDLAIEIDVSHWSIPRLPIYAALGVPEVWRYDGTTIHCLVLKKNDYVESEFSLAFPKLRVKELVKFVRIAEEKADQNAAIKAFRAWMKKHKHIK